LLFDNQLNNYTGYKLFSLGVVSFMYMNRNLNYPIMKNLVLFLAISLISTSAWSKEIGSKNDRSYRIPLIGEKAPAFTAESTNGTIRFPAEFGRSWKILFSHPQDFTPVCTTEIMELAHMQDQFEKIGVKLLVISTDSIYRHKQWKQSMEGIRINNREPAKINFPLVADAGLSVSKEYGMIHASTNTTEAVRGVFIIDPENIIQAIYFYPMTIGRSTDELLRFVTALQATAGKRVSTPVNWEPGGDFIVNYNPRTDLTKTEVLPAGYYSPIWYLTFMKADK
jgi:peroxiredoxin 2/4